MPTIVDLSGRIAAFSVFFFCWVLIVGLGMICLLFVYNHNGWDDRRVTAALDFFLITAAIAGCTLAFSGVLSLFSAVWR